MQDDGKKYCEICSGEIPFDYVNLLCFPCYESIQKQQAIIDAHKEEEAKKRLANPDTPQNSKAVKDIEPASENTKNGSRFGILDDTYEENPEMDDKNQILANLAQFIYSHDAEKGKRGKMLWYPQRNMYTFIKNYCMGKVLAHPQYPKYIWKPDIVDIGCGSGVGANVMSQEANFVWGIDKNGFSIEFAQECFTRNKNGIYYSSQLTFDQVDIMTDNRDFMKFDVVVAIEVIEHIYDIDTFLRKLIEKFTKRDKKGSANIPHGATEFFFSTPNRAFHKLRKDRPANIYHVREHTSFEFAKMLRAYYEKVEILNQKGQPVPEDTDKDEVILARCSLPKM